MILRLVDQIRVVDQGTFDFLEKRFASDVELYIAPSLMNIDATFRCPPNLQHNLVPRLIFVGRLHEERNPADFIRLLRMLDSKVFAFNAQIIGSGPLADELKLQTLDLVARNVLRFPGELTGNKLFAQYCHSDILISCAKHESYGRAMREALYFGVRVLTFETTGSNSLRKEVGFKFVSHFSPDITPDQLILSIEELLGSEVDSETKLVLLRSQNMILETLSDHWDTLVNKTV
jgi:glycosyltransferase involved in cell wall biosynthesis